MGFKKHCWIKYGIEGELVIDMRILNGFGGEKIDSFKCNNNKDYVKILNIIDKKYGFSPKLKKITFFKEETVDEKKEVEI